METIMNWWLSIWLYVMTAIAIILVIKVMKNKDKWTKLNIFCTLAIVVLVLHVIEEWVFPGGLHYSYNINHGSNILSAYPMNRLTDMITNFGGVILGCIILKFWGFKKPAGLAVMIFCFAEVMIHVLIGIQDLAIFEPYGARFFYDPGLVTSLFGFLPIGILLGIELFKNKPRPTIKQWAIAIGATVVFAFLLINLPENLLKNENNQYYSTYRGYYEKYGEQYEKDNNIKYILEENE